MGSKYNFGPFEIDLAGRKLFKNGEPIDIQQKPFELLMCLVERYPNVVTRIELAQRIWPDTHVSIQQNLNTAVRKVRIALEDSVLDPQYVETVGRRGYRFLQPPQPVAGVDVEREPIGDTPAGGAEEASPDD